MSRQPNQKLKILYLRQMLLDETDDEHGLSMSDILERLAEHDIPAERKSIYRDIAALREFGMDIIKRYNEEAGCVEYAVGKREFQMPELLLLADAVQGSRFLTERKTQQMVAHLRTLASRYEGERLAGRVYVKGRLRKQNETVFYNVNEIQQAIADKKKIGFQYQKYDADKELRLRKDGRSYERTPVCLIYQDDFYYLVNYSAQHDGLAPFRVDLMRNIKVLDAPADRSPLIDDFDPDRYHVQSFGMFPGKVERIEIVADSELIGVFVDRFGRDIDVKRQEDGRVRLWVEAMVSKQFYGWLAGLGAQVEVVGPDKVRREFADYLRKICTLYG